MRVAALFVFAAAFYAVGFSSAIAQRTGAFVESFNHPAILYSTTAANSVVDELNRKLADGSATLTFDPQSGYLKSVLDLLKVPVESQVLVYTQTSQQAEKITPQNPRAIYFNDNVSVGYVRGGGILEIVAQDPQARLGVLRDPPAARPRAQHRARAAMPALPPVVGHARRARHERAQHVPAQDQGRLRQRFLRGSLPADRRAMGRLVRHRQARAGAAHGELPAVHAEAAPGGDGEPAARARVDGRARSISPVTRRRTATSWR